MNRTSRDKDAKMNTFTLFKSIFKFLKPERKRVLLGIFFTFFNALSYVIGTVLTGFIVTICFSNDIISDPNSTFPFGSFFVLITWMAISFIIYTICRLIQNRIFIDVSFIVATRIRRIGMEKVMDMPVSYYNTQKSGDIISTLVNDINNLTNSLVQILNESFTTLFQIIFSFIAMAFLSSTLALIILVSSLILYSVGLLLLKKARPNFIKLQNNFGRLNAYVEEMLQNSKITQTFDRQNSTKKHFSSITRDIFKSGYRGDVYNHLFDPWFIMATNILYLGAAAISLVFKTNNIPTYGLLSLFNMHTVPDTGFIIAFTSLLFNYSGVLQNYFNIVLSLQLGVASTKRILTLVDLEPPKKIANPISLKNVKGYIEFNNVNFKYDPNSMNYQLKGASFKAYPGQTIAIVGPTGAGKTTLINLLSKFYDYQDGSIKIDNIELKNITKYDLRDTMAVVLQDSFMFNDTIFNNLKVAKPNATKDEIIEACKLVSAHDFIMKLENAYDTTLENNGLSLSHGERQLLSIARAILGNKKIIILDEATSNIDSNTEQIIQNALQKKIMKNKTSIVIAHRLSTIKNANKILVIEQGQIIETGTHQELIDKKGYYYNLYRSQFE